MSEEIKNERESKEVKVGDHTFKLNVYVTGRELRKIESETYGNVEMKQVGGAQEFSGFGGETLEKRQDARLKAVVVSMDGKSENLIDRIIDLRSQDYSAIVQHVEEIIEGKEVAVKDNQS